MENYCFTKYEKINKSDFKNRQTGQWNTMVCRHSKLLRNSSNKSEMRPSEKSKFFKEAKNYFWEDPYLFRICSDYVTRGYVSAEDAESIVKHFCHEI